MPHASSSMADVPAVDALESVRVVVGRLAAHSDEDVADLPLVGLENLAGKLALAVSGPDLSQSTAWTCL